MFPIITIPQSCLNKEVVKNSNTKFLNSGKIKVYLTPDLTLLNLIPIRFSKRPVANGALG